MRAGIIISFFTLLICFGCGSVNETNEKEQETVAEAKGGRNYGGIFHCNESEYIKNLFPHNITDAFSYRVAQQVYEGLFKFNEADITEIEKSLVEDYTIDESGTVYTFKLKEGVMFHDDPCFKNDKGRELTADDVKYCFTRLCTQSINNQNFSVFSGILKGADTYYEATTGGKTPAFDVEGIKV